MGLRESDRLLIFIKGRIWGVLLDAELRAYPLDLFFLAPLLFHSYYHYKVMLLCQHVFLKF